MKWHTMTYQEWKAVAPFLMLEGENANRNGLAYTHTLTGQQFRTIRSEDRDTTFQVLK